MHKKRTKRLLALLFFLYLAGLLHITVFRPGFSLTGLGQNGVISPTPFLEYYHWLRTGLYGTACYLFFGNIGGFLPFGAYLSWRWPGLRLWQVTLAGFGLSFAIEAGQYLFGTGVSDLADLILNTLGVLLGAALLKWGRRRWRRHDVR
ncbi:MAG: VanZ family protein [Oscillospiraceae bacterium]|nr:VanZ family protein [Oscillospiraceae bacterium]